MALGWKTLIPISLVNLVLVALAALGGFRGLADPRHDPLGRRHRRLPRRDAAARGAEAVRGATRSRRRPAPAPRRPDVSFWDDVLLLDIFDGLKITGRHLFRKADTVEYPEQAAREPSDRFRGMFRLDEERCIKCTLCAIECPINIIFIDWHNEKNEQGKNEKVLDRFDVDLKRCMFCGLCEEACPTVPKSIWLTDEDLRARDLRAQRRALPRHQEAHEVGRERQAVHRRRAGGGAVTASVLLLALRARRRRRRRRRRRDAPAGPLGALPAPLLLRRRGALHHAAGRVPRGGPDPRLRGRDHGPLPLHDHAREHPPDGRASRSCTGRRARPSSSASSSSRSSAGRSSPPRARAASRTRAGRRIPRGSRRRRSRER